MAPNRMALRPFDWADVQAPWGQMSATCGLVQSVTTLGAEGAVDSAGSQAAPQTN